MKILILGDISLVIIDIYSSDLCKGVERTTFKEIHTFYTFCSKLSPFWTTGFEFIIYNLYLLTLRMNHEEFDTVDIGKKMYKGDAQWRRTIHYNGPKL